MRCGFKISAKMEKSNVCANDWTANPRSEKMPWSSWFISMSVYLFISSLVILLFFFLHHSQFAVHYLPSVTRNLLDFYTVVQ